MNEIDELNLEIDKLISSFASLDVVKNYKSLKKAVENDPHLNEILQRREELQKSVKQLPFDQKNEVLRECLKLQQEYDNSPLVINLKVSKEEVLKLIEPLTETKL